MKTMLCEDARVELLDYVERELDDAQRDALSQHLTSCPRCREELQEIERLRGALGAERVPDPGAVFWDKFPDQVWQAYRAERSTARQTNLGARLWETVLARMRSFAAPLRWVPATVTAALIVGLALFFALESPTMPGIVAFQSKIHGGPDIVFAKREVLDLPEDHQYGFAATPGSVNFFRIGHEYAQSLVFAAGGDVKSAAGHLAVIADLLTAAPDALTSLARGKPTPSQIAALEPELARIAAHAGAREAALFRAGGWLANLALAVAARDEAALKAATVEITRLQHDLERAGAVPPGALRDLAALANLMDRLNERDYDHAAQLIRNIRSTLI
jgi:Putative zinc-finger